MTQPKLDGIAFFAIVALGSMLLVAVFMLGYCTGWTDGVGEERKKAIEKNVGRYRVVEEGPRVEFVYGPEEQ